MTKEELEAFREQIWDHEIGGKIRHVRAVLWGIDYVFDEMEKMIDAGRTEETVGDDGLSGAGEQPCADGLASGCCAQAGEHHEPDTQRIAGS